MARLDIGNKNLCELDGLRFAQLRSHLNISDSPHHGWKSIVAVLDGEYTLIPREYRKIGSAECPAESLILTLGGMGMTVDEFASYAAKTGDAVLMNIFNCHVDITITDQPMPMVVGLDGGSLSLSVNATGFPRPEYQWNKDGRWIYGATERHYQCTNLTVEDAGTYRCLVFQGLDVSTAQLSQPSVVTVMPTPDLKVKQHPRNTPVSLGSNALLSCDVWGPQDMCYQWFKGSSPLQDGPRIRGCLTNELHLYNIDMELLGLYHCQVTWGKKSVRTKGAALQIAELLQQSDKNYTASDKVALLIGCSDYRSDKVLKAPYNDVQTLASIFQSLNFKVISLLDLTRNEIIAAVQEFCELVGPGVYCVFYFCGHGFDCAAGQVYLVPCDAPQGHSHVNCVSSNKICNTLLEKEPQLLCMILDVCRKPRDVEAVDLDVKEPVKRGNTVMVYGTSYGLAAYEDGQHGIVVNHLRNFLSLPISVEAIFQNFRYAIHNDPKLNCSVSKKQIPQVITNLSEPGRSFADPIDYRGFTAITDQRRYAWEQAHRVPKSRVVNVEFPGFTVKVKVDFQQVYSNVLSIFTTVLDPGLSEECAAWVCGIPNSVAEKAKVSILTRADGDNLFRSHVQLYNIHKLKNDMMIKIEVTCMGPEPARRTETITDLGLPLVAVLRLWEERPDFTRPRSP